MHELTWEASRNLWSAILTNLLISEWIRNTSDYAHLNQKGAPERNELHSYSSFMSKELHEETIDMFLQAARQKPAEQIDADVQSGLGILFNLSGKSYTLID